MDIETNKTANLSPKGRLGPGPVNETWGRRGRGGCTVTGTNRVTNLSPKGLLGPGPVNAGIGTADRLRPSSRPKVFFLAPARFSSCDLSLNSGDAPRQKSKRCGGQRYIKRAQLGAIFGGSPCYLEKDHKQSENREVARKKTFGRVGTSQSLGWTHNPKVVGSNPNPASFKA